MLRLQLARVDSLFLSPLCRRCPQGRAGCCAAPPAVAWTDIGRIVRHGGRDFLLAEMREGRLSPSPRGLAIRRVPASADFPVRCTYLGPGDRGCILEPERRSATCNYYLCEDAFVLAENEGDSNMRSIRQAHDRIAELLGVCDLELSASVDERFPNGPRWDEAFLDWLANEFDAVMRRYGKEWKKLGPGAQGRISVQRK